MTLPPGKWQAILAAYGRRCCYCGGGDAELTEDHCVPRAQGGSDDAENIVPACPRCNLLKGARTPQEFAERLESTSRPLASAGETLVVPVPRPGHTAVPVSVLRDGTLSVGARALYCSVLSYLQEGAVVPTQRELAVGLNISPRSLQGYLLELERRHLLAVTRPLQRGPNIYRALALATLS